MAAKKLDCAVEACSSPSVVAEELKLLTDGGASASPSPPTSKDPTVFMRTCKWYCKDENGKRLLTRHEKTTGADVHPDNGQHYWDCCECDQQRVAEWRAEHGKVKKGPLMAQEEVTRKVWLALTPEVEDECAYCGRTVGNCVSDMCVNRLKDVESDEHRDYQDTWMCQGWNADGSECDRPIADCDADPCDSEIHFLAKRMAQD
mgnify:CR=1 FL=1